MTKFKLVTAVLALALMGPAVAANVTTRELPTGYDGRYDVIHRLPAQDYDHLDFGIARPAHHSGWSGPYGDGDYPGTIDQNMGPPYWGFH